MEDADIIWRILRLCSINYGSDERFPALVGVMMRRMRRIVKKMKFLIEYVYFKYNKGFVINSINHG